MLKVLPENISNLIAAGEVVSRPASVVKELMENAVDAGTRNVTVVIADAGRTLIQVIDDGSGMSSDEALLCFERHATSKISEAADLEAITTFGFRGEALPSIAAVSEVSLKTRREGDAVGTQVQMAASRLVSTNEVSTPKGSNFEIRNLFYNVPARRKFLKSDNAELKHIITEFTRVALTRPHVAMRLVSNGRDIYNLRAVTSDAQRIKDFFGGEMLRDLVPVDADTSVVGVHGWIGSPEDARKTLGQQYLFVNGRYFRSPYLNKAVSLPYEKLIPEGYMPVYFIYLETEPGSVDINIHPAKTEVKFEDEQMVFDILKAAVREGLGRNAFAPTIDFDMEGAPEIPTLQSTVNAHRGGAYVAPPKIEYDPLFNPFENENGRLTSQKEYEQREEPAVAGYDSLFKDDTASTSSLLVIDGRYIVTPSAQGMTVTSVVRARERIFYERYLECVAEDQPVQQRSLFPVTVKLLPEDYLTVLDESERLNALGFDVQDFGDETVVVYGMPDGFPTDEESVRRVIDEMVATLKERTIESDYKSHIAARMASSAARMYGGSITDSEARLLLSQLEECHCPGATADGRRIKTYITTEDIEKKI